MPEIPRTRDVHVLLMGPSFTIRTSPGMDLAGWPGGQGVAWVDVPDEDDFNVDFSDGERAGFLLWGSNEDSDVLTGMTENQPTYSFGVLGTGTWIIMTRTFETFTLASRNMGPLVPITYSVNDKLVFSLRGFFTNEDEWTINADPRAPNEFVVGVVMQAPSALTENYMTIQTTL